MKHSIATVSLSGTLIEKVNAIAKAGYDGVELFENDLLVSDLRPDELRSILTDLNLELVGLQPFRDYEAMPEPYKSRSLERAKHKFELMHKIGTKKLFICSNTSVHVINSLDKAAEDLYDIAELAKQQGFEIGYEALSWGRHVNTYHQSVEIVRRANHPNLGNILDNFHIDVLGSTYEDIYTIPKDKFTIIQVADSLRYEMGAIHIGRHLRCFPGQGSYPVVNFLKAVQATGYEGYLSHEIFNDDFRASSVEPVALDGKRSLVWLGEAAKEKLPDSVKKILFLEFSCDEPNKSKWIEILENLGFVETHQHRTKSKYCYRLGDIDFILNCEKSQQSPISNSVSALGFQIQDTENMRKWAKDLQYVCEDNDNGLSAVKGVSGLTYYFQEALHLDKNDFVEVALPKNESYIQRIDHIGHSTSNDLYLSNALFYRAFLGLDVEESLEILDPRGIVYSRVAKNASGSIRIPLSSTRSQGTATEQFICRTGTGIQQIAFESGDIFLTAEAIKNKDLILPIPNNYYADLRAKTQLSEEIIDNMQQHDILYDCQANGEFFHFYFKELNGLFFEVVQRKGMYNRYGEVNAQIRLAAQERNR